MHARLIVETHLPYDENKLLGISTPKELTHSFDVVFSFNFTDNKKRLFNQRVCISYAI